MSMTSALISVESAAAMSFCMRLRLCEAHRFTYSARTIGVTPGSIWPALSPDTPRAAAACVVSADGDVLECSVAHPQAAARITEGNSRRIDLKRRGESET